MTSKLHALPHEQTLPIAPGAHIVVRDAVWRVTQVNRTSSGTQAWHVIGISEIVRDQEAIFLEEYEPSVEVLDPRETKLEEDTSTGHRNSLLYMESLLRDVPPTGPELHIGHRAAMDVLDFQLEPAYKSLQQTRQRILIADAVGLGKTLEAGILLSELIRRGRAKRILVATVKSMLTQFQKEMWSRFTIPLVRLDSIGLQRIREHIPTNHNPFHYYDKAIISIDTLKQNNAFRAHVENAWWDVIVIDEAHNVAARGGKRSQRARIAELLSARSDSLILLSATPHDGKARSFASLMNMLDPTAIANPDEYSREDIEGLFVRRFKKDVLEQLGKAFPKRDIAKAQAESSPEEEAAFEILASLSFTRIDQRSHANMLFKTTLEKALFSSPQACIKTINERVKRLEKREDSDVFVDDIEQLRALEQSLTQVTPGKYGKYQKLLQVISDKKQGFGWTPRKRDDRLVIFSERIETLRFLEEQLSKDLKLKPAQVVILHGGLSDKDQQEIVEEFGKETSKLRLLLASDVASEGLNLHFFCHRLIHFDVPWSLMVFQQRNGRIDRYGQQRTPYIVYMLTQSDNAKIRGDQRILELLIERDEQAIENIGDPSALLGVYDIDEQEKIVADAIEGGLTAEELDEQKFGSGTILDPLELLLGGGPEQDTSRPSIKEPLSLFSSDFDYLKTSLDRLSELEGVIREIRERDHIIELTLPKDLQRRFKKLPTEVMPKDKVVVLTDNREKMMDAIEKARHEEVAWPNVQYLWPNNPVLNWANDKARGAFGRQVAPVLSVHDGLAVDELFVIVSGLIPNRRSQPLVHRWFAVRFERGRFHSIEDFGDFLQRTGFGKKPLHNRKEALDLEQLQSLIPEAVEQAREQMLALREEFEKDINTRLNTELSRLETLRERQLEHLGTRIQGRGGLSENKQQQEIRRIHRTFHQYLEWVEDSMTTEPAPFLQVIALLRPENGFGGVA